MGNKRKLAFCLLIAAESLEKSKKQRKKIKFQAKEWLDRSISGDVNLLEELCNTEEKDFSNYLRMDDATFNMLLAIVS